MVNFMDFYYTDPGTLAGQYMRKFWHPVYRAEDLKPGWAKPIKIMGEQFTLYRGDEGTPHVVDFRCPHRQTQLSVGWVEGDCIRCRFHGWKFDSSGQCIEQPAEKRVLRRKDSHSQLSHPGIPQVDLRLLRRRRAATTPSLSGF